MKINKFLCELYGVENVSSVGETEIYRCVKKADGQAYAIEYIDFTNSWINCEIKAYLEPIISEEFYATEGHLQWNFYYFFISSAEIIQKNLQVKTKIEKNESFARKSVQTLIDFKNLQRSLKSIDINDEAILGNDLYTIWINELRKCDLEFINSDDLKTYKKPIDNFLNNIPKALPNLTSVTKTIDDWKGFNHIKKLSLESFRDMPEKKKYDFGRVMLVYGANATGKTSFLDSIELAVTGKCSKQQVKHDYRIDLVDDTDVLYSYPSSRKRYKLQDGSWYNNYMIKGNNLNGNFNRFNYFTSDAAYELKKNDDDDRESLEKVIADIALGQEVNKLEEKMSGFQKRFSELSLQYKKQLDILEDDLAFQKKELTAVEAVNTEPSEFKAKLIQEINDRKWKLQSFIDDDALITQVSISIQFIKDRLEKLENLSKTISIVNRGNLENELLRLIKIGNKINQLAENHRTINQSSPELTDLNIKIETLKSLRPYFNHPDIDVLLGLGKNLSEIEEQIKQNEQIYFFLQEVPVTDNFVEKYENLDFFNIESVITSRRDELIKKQSETTSKLQEMENGIGRLQNIISDLKASSMEYVKLKPNAKDCPACGTSFEQGELIEALRKSEVIFSNSKTVNDLKLTREAYRNDIISIEIEHTTIVKLKELYSIDSDFIDFGLNNLAKYAKNLSSKNRKIKKEKIKLEKIKSQFHRLGLTEERFFDLMTVWKKFGASELSKENLKTLLSSFSSARQRLQNKIKRLSTTLKDSNKDEDLLRYRDIELLNKEIYYSEEAIRAYKDLHSYLSLPEDINLNNCFIDLSTIESAHNLFRQRYYEEKKAEIGLKSAEQTIQKLTSRIVKTKTLRERAKIGEEALTSILSRFNKNEFLNNYINENRKSIVKIFNLIHSPKEFQDILFVENKIKLVSPNSSRPLDEISTGQRSALALSVFLSLNAKLQKGPNIMLFDDPIAYVDDLNILSFLDYLREIVLKSKKQVVFVTANSDLAFLFKMKFNFLTPEHFSAHEFQRSSMN